ncbi:MAG: hypothetical protein JSR48_14035 [Verrucomicrobia bacterium]|nr:hypothetical protein [Verrucomicrobiota bacterium]
MRTLLGLMVLIASGAWAADHVLFADDFAGDLSQWAVEQQPGGSARIESGKLVIADQGGCTVWFRPRLTVPVRISYDVTVSSAARVSDLNCFWMASEVGDGAVPPFAPGHARDGKFAVYDSLRTYYVGYGGNTNTTTRFRRYDGAGHKPLLPQHDLSAPKFLLQPDHTYHIEITADASGRTRWSRDGEIVFDFQDPSPLTSGWFAFRTVQSRLVISRFRVSALESH